MNNFSIGDKVVCVDDKFPPDISKLYDALPVKDSTYVVRDIRLGINLTLEGDVSVLLIGLVNPKADSKANLERGFRAGGMQIAQIEGSVNLPDAQDLRMRLFRGSPI